MSEAAPIIFLDIDGVLNGHDFDTGAQSCTIRPECVGHLNRILRETGAKVVLSSAWRYLVVRGDMTLGGFRYLLQTHGVAECDLIGMTRADEDCVYCGHLREEPNLSGPHKQPTCPKCGKECLRSDWIAAWMADEGNPAAPWLVLDDMPMPGLEGRHVATIGEVGLTEADVNLAVYLLTKEPDRVPATAC